MCSVSYAFSQEHVLRCSVLLQLKGYTALALDTLCQSVSDNVTAFKYLLRQAIASRQRVCIVCVSVMRGACVVHRLTLAEIA